MIKHGCYDSTYTSSEWKIKPKPLIGSSYLTKYFILKEHTILLFYVCQPMPTDNANKSNGGQSYTNQEQRLLFINFL